MLSDIELQYLKEDNSGHKLLYVRFSGDEFVFRSITIKEYEMLMHLYPKKENFETAICNLSVIEPEEYEFQTCPYGYFPTYISEFILKISDMSGQEDLEELYYSNKINYNFFQNCLDLIKAFIPEYTYEEMEDWTWQKVMQMVVRAERIALLKGFDYHINFESIKQIEKPSDDELIKQRINPILYHYDEIEEELKRNKIMAKDPFIIGIAWNNQEVLNGFREQKNQKHRQTRE